MNQCFGRTKWFANVWVNLPLKKPLNKKKTTRPHPEVRYGDPQNPPKTSGGGDMLICKTKCWDDCGWRVYGFKGSFGWQCFQSWQPGRWMCKWPAQLQWGKLGMQCTQTAWEFSFSTCWPVVVINFHPNYWLHCPPDRHQLVHISLGHKQWQMSTGKVIPTIISLNRLVYKFHYFFHGVLTSRLSLTIYANKTRAGSRWRCWWPKQFEVLAPAVTGQGPGTLGKDVGWGWSWLDQPP